MRLVNSSGFLRGSIFFKGLRHEQEKNQPSYSDEFRDRAFGQVEEQQQSGLTQWKGAGHLSHAKMPPEYTERFKLMPTGV
jgi:hypothetical protein